MANVKTGVCPSCGKERELAYIKFGIIQSTMCPFCLEKYLSRFVLPQLRDNYNEATDKCVLDAKNKGVVVGGFLKDE